MLSPALVIWLIICNPQKDKMKISSDSFILIIRFMVPLTYESAKKLCQNEYMRFRRDILLREIKTYVGFFAVTKSKEHARRFSKKCERINDITNLKALLIEEQEKFKKHDGFKRIVDKNLNRIENSILDLNQIQEILNMDDWVLVQWDWERKQNRRHLI